MERLERELQRERARFEPAPGLTEVVAAWPDVAGPTVAAHAWPARFTRDRTLIVHAESATWAFELTQLAPLVLERLRTALAELAPSGLRFAVGPLPSAEAPSAAAAGAAPRASAAERKLAESLTAAIDDEELRSVVARAAAASLPRAVSDR